MKKIHTKTKRRYQLPTRLSHYKFFHPGTAEHRPRTFNTEDAAKAWAKEQGVENYTLKKVKNNKRFQVVPVA